MPAEDPLSPEFVAVATSERANLAARLAEFEERIAHFEALTFEAREHAASVARRMRDLDEILGLSPQIAMCELDTELRGEKLREVAIAVLREATTDGEPIHYRAWFDALVRAGYRVAGKDPLATFLTQVSRIDGVQPVGRRSGLYHLRLAA